ncbi:MAG TPA: methyltransferase [Bacteroidales bacterium]|nr:methyltransferase [Bacteroidales bacterium]
MSFRFKQFSIDDSLCAMKVGTDSVLLGAWADFNGASRILDIGTGSGLLALMAAQQCRAEITAIDIDQSCCIQATRNFENSAWNERLKCIHTGLRNFISEIAPHEDIRLASPHELPDGYFDHIISNPPWFTASLKSTDNSRNRARHNDELPPEDLVQSSNLILAENGRFSLIIPWSDKDYLINLCKSIGLFPSREIAVIPRTGKAPNRILLEFTKGLRAEPTTSTITIRDIEGNYTPEYKQLTREFYLNF